MKGILSKPPTNYLYTMKVGVAHVHVYKESAMYQVEQKIKISNCKAKRIYCWFSSIFSCWIEYLVIAKIRF